ncbi:MAG: type II secretion system protein GspM [Pseudomonadales bacterium]
MNYFDWFLQLKQREQWVLVIGSAVVLFYIFFILLWRPLQNDNEQLVLRNAEAAKTLEWMRSSAADLKAGTQQQRKGKTAANGNLTQMLDSSISKFGMQFSRFQPKGANRAQVWFDATEFASLVAWLDELDKQKVYATSVSLNSTQQTGRINASVALQQF